MDQTRPHLRIMLLSLVAWAIPIDCLAAPTASLIALAPYGDAITGSAGAAVPLSPTSFLVSTEGPDGMPTTADDVTRLVTELVPSFTVTALATPALSDYSGQIARLSATRALVFSAGPDKTWTTADDVVYLLDHLGSANTVTTITVGGLGDRDANAPQMLSADSAVLSTAGPDNARNTADDTVALLTDLGGTNTVTYLSAPFIIDGTSLPVPLSPTSFLVSSRGPDGTLRTADDLVYLFTGVGTTNDRMDLPTPRLFSNRPGRAVRVNATRAVVCSTGADGQESTADDQVLLLDALGTSNTVTPISVASIQNYGAGSATPLADDLVLLATEGPDSIEENGDDTIAVISGLGTTNTVTSVPVGSLDEDVECRPVRLSPTSVAFATGGAAGTLINTADDDVVVISDVGGANTVTRIPVPGLAGGTTSRVVPLSATALLVSSGGPNGHLQSGGDDVVTLVTNIGGTPLVETVSVNGSFGDDYGLPYVPQLLGAGHAVLLNMGPNGVLGTGDDDALMILDGLPNVRALTVGKLALKFNPAKPEKGESIAVAAVLATDDPTLLAGADVTITVGNAAQTIPAASFVGKKGTFTYADTKGANGFLRKVTYNTKKRTLTIAGKGVGTGAETTDCAYIPVAIEAGNVYLSDAVAATACGPGIKFAAPK